MTVEECYKEMGADYTEISHRFPSDSFIKKFAIKFLDDPSFPDLEKYLAEQNVEEAFRAVHTLKGVAQNLAFVQLYPLSVELTEILRAGKLEGTAPLLAQLKEKYDLTIRCIQEMAKE